MSYEQEVNYHPQRGWLGFKSLGRLESQLNSLWSVYKTSADYLHCGRTTSYISKDVQGSIDIGIDLAGTTVALRTYDGKYVSAKDKKLSAGADSIKENELFSLAKITEELVAFKASNGKYVRVVDGNGLVAD